MDVSGPMNNKNLVKRVPDENTMDISEWKPGKVNGPYAEKIAFLQEQLGRGCGLNGGYMVIGPSQGSETKHRFRRTRKLPSVREKEGGMTWGRKGMVGPDKIRVSMATEGRPRTYLSSINPVESYLTSIPRDMRSDDIFKQNGPKVTAHSARPPAARRQTKNGGKNHGRWFYTCAQLPPRKCGFFLWADEAEPREKAVVLSNSRTEIDPLDSFMRTPTKSTLGGPNGLLTPQTERRVIDIPPRQFKSPPKTAKARMMAEDSDEFGWNQDSDDDDEITQALLSSQATEPILSQPIFYPELAVKVPRTPGTTSPGKRKLSEFAFDQSNSTHSEIPTPTSTRASQSSRFPPSSAEVCMTPTPSRNRDLLSSDSKPDESDLFRQASAILETHGVVLPNRAYDQLVQLLNSHDMKLKGVNRARDILRTAMKKKEDEILLLKEKNTNLQAQNEMDRSIINSFNR
ncbi:Zinc finger GRF-type [Penicillium canariense]|uniref:Zinc finger GRF-type n=1 Tax=Penicillium canariense TaxID=189055 RepID=A0A9W9HQD3_9EURO|nr:Zinc finger GRF-type [Penicillium canariense]KAJ5153407.1 Zinc finger GRF-type [Penicillium canariense]